MIPQDIIDTIRMTSIKLSAAGETPDYESGYLDGQNEMLDRVVDCLENIQEDATKTLSSICHQRAVIAFMEHELNSPAPINMREREMEGWCIS
jgi:hypothetical protein